MVQVIVKEDPEPDIRPGRISPLSQTDPIHQQQQQQTNLDTSEKTVPASTDGSTVNNSPTPDLARAQPSNRDSRHQLDRELTDDEKTSKDGNIVHVASVTSYSGLSSPSNIIDYAYPLNNEFGRQFRHHLDSRAFGGQIGGEDITSATPLGPTDPRTAPVKSILSNVTRKLSPVANARQDDHPEPEPRGVAIDPVQPINRLRDMFATPRNLGKDPSWMDSFKNVCKCESHDCFMACMHRIDPYWQSQHPGLMSCCPWSQWHGLYI